MMNRRQEILTGLVLILLVINIALQVRAEIALHRAVHEPYTQYCDWVQPGRVLTCHR